MKRNARRLSKNYPIRTAILIIKISLTITFLILAIGSLLGWKQSEQLTRIRETQRQVIAALRAHGLFPESMITSGKLAIHTKRERESAAEKTAHAKALASEYIAWKKAQKTADDDQSHQQYQNLILKLLRLDFSQIKVLLEEYDACSEIDEDVRMHLKQLALLDFSRNDPETTLSLYLQSFDMTKLDSKGNHVVSLSLGAWAEESPLEARDWLRINGEKYPTLLADLIKSRLLIGVLKEHPEQALSMIGELKSKDVDGAISCMAHATTTDKMRTDLLTAVRNQRPADSNLSKKILGCLAYNLLKNDYETCQAWISTAALSAQEAQDLAGGISSIQNGPDAGKWIEWMADKLPPEKISDKTRNLIENWADKDYKAAGEWISSRPDGPVKQAAVLSYAQVIAPHEPASAAQWALTLPDGKRKKWLLGIVHSEWNKKDPAAAAEFARQQGIKSP